MLGQLYELARADFVQRTRNSRYVVVLAVGVAAALTALSGPLADWLGQSDVAAFLLAGGVYVVAYAVTSYCISVFQGLNRVGWSARGRMWCTGSLTGKPMPRSRSWYGARATSW